MKVTFAGTRGSCAVSAFDKLWFGGNTPCLRVDSQCLPEKHWLIVDAGTGILPLSWQFAGEGADEVTIILTHSHHDHTGGFPLSLFPYLKRVLVNVYGPVERGMGPREVYKTLMQPPFFPVDLTQVGSHLRFFKIEKPNATVLVIHPVGGRKSFAVEAFERLERDGRQIPFRGGKKFNLNECLVIKMHRTEHPERTISYRFEERPTGQVFVHVTDHENQDGILGSFRAHVQGADLLTMDTQYTRERYDKATAGFGHGTPDYAGRVAREMRVKALALFHHDTMSSDALIRAIGKTAAKEANREGESKIFVFPAWDNLVVDLADVEGSVRRVGAEAKAAFRVVAEALLQAADE